MPLPKYKDRESIELGSTWKYFPICLLIIVSEFFNTTNASSMCDRTYSKYSYLLALIEGCIHTSGSTKQASNSKSSMQSLEWL